MDKSWSYLNKVGRLLLVGSVIGVLLAACGGSGGGGSGGNKVDTPVATSSATISPFKGPFSSGAVTLKDANGKTVALITGGTVNANGVATVSYSANVVYPLVVEVTGTYYNEVTGMTETSTSSLRGIIISASNVAANSPVPVTMVTETAVADLQNRLGTFSSSSPITTTSAAASLSTAGTVLGIPASTVPVFDHVTRKTSDANTLRLAALAVVANNQIGATLLDKVKVLVGQLVTLGANPPTNVISQTAYDNALATVTSGALSMLATGATAPTPATISTTGYGALYATYIPTGVAMVWGQTQALWGSVDWQ